MKKIVAAFLSVVMLFSFASCGERTDTSVTYESTSADSTNITDEQQTTEEVGSSTSKAFKIGVIASGEKNADSVKNGAMLAADEINSKGGIQLEIKAESGGEGTTGAVIAYDTLKLWGMQALVGTADTDSCDAVASKSNEDRIFQLALCDSAENGIHYGSDNVFRLCNGKNTEEISIVDYIAAKLPNSKVGVIYGSDYQKSKDSYDAFIAAAKHKGIEVVYEGSYTSATAWDFSSQLVAAQNAQAGVLFIPMKNKPAAIVIEQAQAMGYTPVFIGTDDMKKILSTDGINKKYIDNIHFLTEFSSKASDSATEKFVAAYKHKYDSKPDLFSAYGYDAVYVIYEAIAAAEIKRASIDNEKMCKKLIAAMSEITVNAVTGESMKWNNRGELTEVSRAVVIKDGAYTG